MHHLPQTIAFNPDDYPALSEIFGAIDVGIAAIVAADPTFRPKQAQNRRKPTNRQAGAIGSPRHSARRAAA